MKSTRSGKRRQIAYSRSPVVRKSRLNIPPWKRFLDVSLVVMTVPAWLPVMLVIGAGIKLLSPGPVLFRQERIGHRGRCFVCLKYG